MDYDRVLSQAKGKLADDRLGEPSANIRARIEKALVFSEFSVLQAQEEELGFREKMPRSESFFRKGEIGSWRGVLTESQVQQIVADHGPVMRRFGYLEPDGTIVD